MSKITAFRNKKINCNEDKSKVKVISRKRKKNKEINIYFNNKPLQKVSTMEYLGIVIAKHSNTANT
jgi:hypothetical protein